MNTKEKIRVGVLFGGRSGEHEVSLLSARSVLSQLDSQKYDITPIGITHEGRWIIGENVLDHLENGDTASMTSVTLLPDPELNTLYALRETQNLTTLEPVTQLDVIFPVLHGTFGEDGTLQGLFEIANLAYVGAGVLGSAVGMDKALFKDLMRSHNLPVVGSIVISVQEINTKIDHVLNKAEAISPYPLFVKPANLGSSVGVNKCWNRSDLLEGIYDAICYDRRVVIECGIDAREIEISVLGNDDPTASIPGEIIPADEFYTYAAKYVDDRTKLIIPADLEPEKIAQFQNLAVKAYQAIDCAGMARVDFLLDKDNGNIYISEVNTIPGFTQISMYPKLWEASGLLYSALIDRLIELALERKKERDRINYKKRELNE